MFTEKLHKTIVLVGILIVVLAVIIGTSINYVIAKETEKDSVLVEDTSQTTDAEQVADKGSGYTWAIFIAIAWTVSMSCLGAAYAVGKVGAAAMGAASERPELMGRALIFVGLAEGIAIYGLIIAIMLLGKI